MDIQTMTPHMARLGARVISREEFLAKLEATRRRGLRLFDRSSAGSLG
jgi:Leu/Phe-tRNA-protein transferase